MKLKKAIEILSDINNAQTSSKTTDSIIAIKLGIEALKRLRALRGWHPAGTNDLIPGETDV